MHSLFHLGGGDDSDSEGDEDKPWKKKKKKKRWDIYMDRVYVVISNGSWFTPFHHDTDAGSYLVYMGGDAVSSVWKTGLIKADDTTQHYQFSPDKPSIADLCRFGQTVFIPGYEEHCVCTKGGLRLCLIFMVK